MALVVFLRGVNVGGHRTFRPSVLAAELSEFDVTSIGAAGTFVVRKPGSRARFRAALAEKLPFEASIAFCDGSEILRLEQDNPFDPGQPPEGVTRFVAVLDRKIASPPGLPVSLPREGDWLVRVIDVRGRLVFGEYRRHMRTIGYLGQIDLLLGASATIRSWSTILKVGRALRAGAQSSS